MSDPDYSMGQWVIRVSDVDPVATVINITRLLFIICDLICKNQT